MAISALPTPPSTANPASFSSDMDAFLGAMPTFRAEANAQAAALALNATTDTSTSSLGIGLGSSMLTVSAGKSFQPGMFLMIADTAAPSTNSMVAQVTSYSGTTLVFNRVLAFGSGTKTAWIISQSAPYAYSLSSAQLAAALTDETGTGAAVFGTSPVLTSPAITGGTINGVVIGGATPAAGSFTSLASTGGASLGAVNATTTTDAYTVSGWTVAGYSGQNLQFGKSNAASQWTEQSAYIQGVKITSTTSIGFAVAGSVTPEADNTRTLGTGALRWSTVYAGTGTINTSDAREKTPVMQFGEAELNAAKQLSHEIGTYRFLASVAAKGSGARTHIGLTVQRATEIMQANGLNPFAYGFICHDVWSDVVVEHPAIDAQAATDTTPASEAKAAWTEQTQWAGDRYAFRYDQLNLFIARGLEARISALEPK